jgi:hypothetical protein
MSETAASSSAVSSEPSSPLSDEALKEKLDQFYQLRPGAMTVKEDDKLVVPANWRGKIVRITKLA